MELQPVSNADITLQLEQNNLSSPIEKFHLFISFCEEDAEYAQRLTEDMERKYNFRCFFHKRDFLPGVTVLRNINYGIMSSEKIVFLISKKFLESKMCMIEVEQGIMESTKSGDIRLIPVLIDDVALPMELQHFNYIDAKTKDVDVPSKIFEAYQFGASKRNIFPNVLDIGEKTNGVDLVLLKGTITGSWILQKMVFKLEILSTLEKKTDTGDSIIGVCKKLSTELTSMHYCKYYAVQRKRVWDWYMCALFFAILAIWGVIALCYISTQRKKIDLITVISFGLFCPLLSLGCLWFVPGFQVKIAKKYKEEVELLLWKYLKSQYRRLKGLPLMRNKDLIVFIRYDTSPCETFIFHVLTSKYPGMDENVLKKKAEDMVLTEIKSQRVGLANWMTLPLYRYNRHNTLLQRKCICEILEAKIE